MRKQHIVAVENYQVLSPAEVDTSVRVPWLPHIRIIAKDPNLFGIFAGHFHGFVAGAVIDTEYFNVGIGLIQGAQDTGVEIFPVIEVGDTYAD
jgi:hypothetical protein